MAQRGTAREARPSAAGPVRRNFMLNSILRTSEAVSSTQAVALRDVRKVGDHTLTIAYWLPESELFVNEHGYPVELPTGDSGRAWTAVEQSGRRVAAIIHDAELEARPELVEVVAAGAVLALGNEQGRAGARCSDPRRRGRGAGADRARAARHRRARRQPGGAASRRCQAPAP